MATKKQTSMQITPPFGYGEIAPMQRTDRVLLPAPGSTPNFCRSINALALSYTEFNAAARDYPIVFASADKGKTYAPVIVLGLADGQNLFVDAAGDWDKTTYLPAFVRRYPFCISTLQVDGEARKEKLVCVVSAYVDKQGIALFDGKGASTPQWQAAERLLQEYESDLDITAEMCAIFAKLELFAPFTFQITQDDKPALKLQGMYRIDEKKLQDLKATNHKALVTKNLMGKIYAHFHSLENFTRLYARAVQRMQQEQAAEKPMRR